MHQQMYWQRRALLVMKISQGKLASFLLFMLCRPLACDRVALSISFANYDTGRLNVIVKERKEVIGRVVEYIYYLKIIIQK